MVRRLHETGDQPGSCSGTVIGLGFPDRITAPDGASDRGGCNRAAEPIAGASGPDVVET